MDEVEEIGEDEEEQDVRPVCASHVFFTSRAECHERVKPANILAQDSYVRRCSCSSMW